MRFYFKQVPLRGVVLPSRLKGLKQLKISCHGEIYQVDKDRQLLRLHTKCKLLYTGVLSRCSGKFKVS